jgi:hypothetical protein
LSTIPAYGYISRAAQKLLMQLLNRTLLTNYHLYNSLTELKTNANNQKLSNTISLSKDNEAARRRRRRRIITYAEEADDDANKVSQRPGAHPEGERIIINRFLPYR